MTKNVLVSIVTVSYNSSKYIKETIDSVLKQSYSNFEYIICDDNSTDTTWQSISEYSDSRIKAYRNETNLGEYENRNKGLSLAKGDYLIFIDGDDVMYPHALSVFLSYAFEFPECAIITARDWDYRIKSPYKVEPADFYRFEFFGTSIMGNFTKILFKTSILKQERFPALIKTGDTYMQLKIAQKHPVLIIPDGLTWWRLRSGNATLNLFKNSKYHAEIVNYRLELLKQSPLSDIETEEAKINVYGIFMRLIVWLLVKGRFEDVFYLLKKVKVPRLYLKSLLIKRKTGFMSTITGDAPLHTKIF